MLMTKTGTSSAESDAAVARLIQEREIVAARVESCMRRSGYYELRGVSCDFHEGVLILRGRVPSFHLKQLAQSLVFHLDGVQELSNRLEVVATPHG
jgi:osmotically-inducible protein OsmY